MKHTDELYAASKWYLSKEIHVIELQGVVSQDTYPVWENHVLIHADGPEEAYRKALQHGQDHDGDVTLDGQPARFRFKGLRDLVFIYDELEDGAEIEWLEYETRGEDVESLIRTPELMHAFKPADIDE